MKKLNWEEILLAYDKRDCTAEEFCRQRAIKPATLQYHQSRLNKKRRKFVPLEAVPTERRSVVLEFANGMRLSIDAL